MSFRFSSQNAAGANSPNVSLTKRDSGKRSRLLLHSVGAVLLRRIKYIARFLYWMARHRSTKHVRWVLAFEGYTW